MAAEDLPADHPAWTLEAQYLAHALATIVCILSPRRIVMGGGVMNARHLLPLIRDRLVLLLNDYIRAPALTADVQGYVVNAALAGRAGVLGALALAERAATGPAGGTGTVSDTRP
jgi:fructokinase